jgi:putative endopeptidase
MKTSAALNLTLSGLTAASAAAPVFPPWGLTLEHIDRQVAPGEDFFRHASGTWLKDAKIPGDRRMAGVNLELNQRNEQQLQTVVSTLDLSPDTALDAEGRKLRDLYRSFNDTRTVEIRGLSPAQAGLDRIAAAKTHADIVALMGDPEMPVDGPFGLLLDIDEKDPAHYVVYFGQSGLGMPDRDYYLLKDKGSVETRNAYRHYLAQMLELAGVKDKARAQAVFDLELRMARLHWPAADRREADKIYNRMSLAALDRLAPAFPWRTYLSAGGVPTTVGGREREVVVHEKSAFAPLARTFLATPVGVWRDYLRVQYLHATAHYLSSSVEQADFAFHGKVINGQTEQLPRTLRGVQLLDRVMGDALGKRYAEQYFPADSKAKVRALVGNLLKAYEADIRTLDWMTEPTRNKALEKLGSFMVKVGYPDSWRDYSSMSIVPGKLFENLMATRRHEWQRQLTRLDGPVDRGDWLMTAPTNNAYYNPVLNEIVFPAGILQPPFFDPAADDAVNYGEIGATIGHEISHGFDDQGSKYDAGGKLRNWWTDADRKAFDLRTHALALQYNAYEPLPGLHLNGQLTLGENIADLAGLVIAHKAYRISLGGKPAPVLDGYTGDQRFYLAYSQSWREVWTDGLMRQTVLSNPHSTSSFRVNGVVRNDDGWYEAFPDIKPGDRFYLPPTERVRLW